MSLISIIVPVYNANAYLSQCITSILNQDYKNLQLILVNDGSTDNSLDICTSFANNDARVKIIDKQNQGVNKAIIDGILSADGEYIGFVDSDDYVMPQMFQHLVAEITKNNAQIVQCGALINGVSKSEKFYSAKEYIFTDIQNQLLKPFFQTKAELLPVLSCRWNKLYSAGVLKNIADKITDSPSIGEDLIMNLYALQQCNKVVVLKDSFYYCYRVHENSISKKFTQNKQADILTLIECLYTLSSKFRFKHTALDLFKQQSIASLMIDACMSSLPIKQKKDCLKQLHSLLTDKSQLDILASHHPFYVKIACNFLKIKLFTPVLLVLKFIVK